jgi:aspartyl-tRNA(Asn)/glutamyl-tRNA(Gln) amidotransferase subunit A
LDVSPKKWRIAYSPTMGYANVDTVVAQITAKAAQVFAEMGAQVDIVDHVMDDPGPLMTRLRRGFTSYAFRHLGKDDFAIMDPVIRDEIHASQGADLYGHFDAELERAALLRRMIAFHSKYDFLLTPTLCIPPFSADVDWPLSETRQSWTSMCFPFNLTRQPAASVPCGFTQDRLPVGLQIVGRPEADLSVLQAAFTFEKAQPWVQHRPDLVS